MIRKMKFLKRRLHEWSTRVFGNLEENVRRIEKRLEEIDMVDESKPLTEEEIAERSKLQVEKTTQQKRVDLLWRQKSRQKWNMMGGINTSYYHRISKFKATRNRVSEIRHGNNTFSGPDAIKRAAVEHYEQFFKLERRARPGLPNLGFSRLATEEAGRLENEVSASEVWEAIKSCGRDRTPGPDSFSFRFIQLDWEVIGTDFVALTRYFFQTNRMARGSNSSFLTLIPKSRDPRKFTDFRRISLVSSYYKIISKVMAGRLKEVIGKVIGEAQHGFRVGYQMLDCVMAANEVVHFLKTSNKQGYLLKLDFEKAYDSVDWVYLHTVMRHMGFRDRLCCWIHQCVSTNRVSVLINGSPTSEFGVERGLRQGCSLSPFLFNIAAEGLSRLLSVSCDAGLLGSIGGSELGWSGNHLQFADDVMIFLQNEVGAVKNVKSILRWFEALSGLRVNFHKSTMIGVNISPTVCSVMSTHLGCRVENFPFPYLGSYVGLNPRRVANW